MCSRSEERRVGKECKITFPYTSSDFFRYTINDAIDNPVPREDKKRIVALYQGRIDEVIRESRRFAN